MAAYLSKVQELGDQFDSITISQVSHAKNTNADVLACLTTWLEEFQPKSMPVEVLEFPSIQKRDSEGKT